jgi:hypothetical protein
MKALSVTKGGNTDDRLCGVFAIIPAMLSAEKIIKRQTLGL